MKYERRACACSNCHHEFDWYCPPTETSPICTKCGHRPGPVCVCPTCVATCPVSELVAEAELNFPSFESLI